MDSNKICKYCKKTFNNLNNSFANHVRWCKENPNRNSYRTRKVSTVILTENRICKNTRCNKEFDIEFTEGTTPKKQAYCSRKCANSRGPRSEDFKIKVKQKLTIEPHKKTCPNCHVEFTTKRKDQIHCSRKCGRKSRINYDDIDPLCLYRQRCCFQFSLNDYPNEFDFSLVERYGWYKAKNRGDNLNGVSRDHIISVKHGYINNIDPNLISHPANCQLLRHNDNVSKLDKCGMTIDDLIQKIKKWDTKYSDIVSSTLT
jgi:hypothetical protein